MADPIAGDTLVRLFRAEGLVVKTPHSGWKDHQRDAATGKAFGPVHGVLVHHTAALNAYAVIYSGRSDLPGPLAHVYIDKAGVLWMASDGRANHAGGGDPDVLRAVEAESYMSRPPAPHYHEGSPGAADGNDCLYGFECENKGDGVDPWPAAQVSAMVRAAAAILRHYGWSEKSCIGHKEWSDQKPDPRGIDMVVFRSKVKKVLASPPGKSEEKPPVSNTPSKSAVYVDIWDEDVATPPAGHATTANPKWAEATILRGAYEHAEQAAKDAAAALALAKKIAAKLGVQ